MRDGATTKRKRQTSVCLTDEQLERLQARRVQLARRGEAPTLGDVMREVIDYGLAVVSIDPREDG